MIILDLPLAPSVNGLYRNARGRGRVKTEKYAAWLTEAGWSLKAQRPVPVVGSYELHIVVPGYRGDIDNRIKAVSDLLVAHGLIDDDSRCVRVSATRDGKRETMRVVVMSAADPLPAQPATDEWIPLGRAVLDALTASEKKSGQRPTKDR